MLWFCFSKQKFNLVLILKKNHAKKVNSFIQKKKNLSKKVHKHEISAQLRVVEIVVLMENISRQIAYYWK
jgi:hypothetical protein